MSQEKIYQLLDKYASGGLTAAEQRELSELLQSLDGREFTAVTERYAQIVEQRGVPGEADTVLFERIRERIGDMEGEMRPVRTRTRWWAAAAVLLALLSAGAYLFNRQPRQIVSLKPAADTVHHEIRPGGNKAVLTLANGSTIVLDEAADGTLAQQGGTNVVKLGNGQLAYVGDGGEVSASVYNTIATPRGGQYRIALSDGTQVWLNAASSIRYPAVFGGSERRVEITGEAYFEVAKDEKRPFTVQINKSTEINVLGTHFNVNAYEDESNIRTTLLEGKVSVAVFGKQNILKPGQQGTVIYGNSGGAVQVKEVDTGEAVAWKEGMFSFKNADLRAVMRQLSRWYDVEVAYEGGNSNAVFEGKIQRELNLADVLDALRKNNVQFRIEGRKIIVRQ
ncbi:FecR family protein [Chitinophaga sp. GCM10012297]|uniref:FecR domain-containing protein n=1 Tax=Chitinophaga chungangae TaxID=2821488 RepID=A0ABS3YCL7_9BACT|nr:FecR family protein [Chitinophaga chungangae]MBO9152401.1 FecR domain-containing protein [Chitinophaga chungangae]